MTLAFFCHGKHTGPVFYSLVALNQGRCWQHPTVDGAESPSWHHTEHKSNWPPEPSVLLSTWTQWAPQTFQSSVQDLRKQNWVLNQCITHWCGTQICFYSFNTFRKKVDYWSFWNSSKCSCSHPDIWNVLLGT